MSGQGHADMFSVDSFGNARQPTSFDAERPSSSSCGDDNVSVSSHCVEVGKARGHVEDRGQQRHTQALGEGQAPQILCGR